MLTAGSVLNWLNQKGNHDLTSQKDAEEFLTYLQNQGVSKWEDITEDHYYDWIDTRI